MIDETFDSATEEDVPAEAPAAEEPEASDKPESAPESAPTDAPPEPAKDNKRWYVIKVQSGREDTIKEAIEKRVKIDGLEEFYGEIVIPTEKSTELRKGKRYIRERKLFPGYFMANVEFNDRILYLFRETSGVGDFVGGGLNKPPQPMTDKEVERLVKSQTAATVADKPQESPFTEGDRVRVKDGTFAGMDGIIKEILKTKGAAVVELTIFGRPVPVELEYWQVEYV